MLPVPPLPPELPLRLTFEISPAGSTERLPEELREIEGGRLVVEGTVANGQRYQKATVVLSLSGGDSRERVLFFAEDARGIRMLGFHRLYRHLEAPQGETVVFDSGKTNPLGGRMISVPADTYSLLGLCAVLGGVLNGREPLRANLWLNERETLPVEIASEAQEELATLGTRVASSRIRVKPLSGASWVALYWFTESAPHTFLQYRGPGEILLDSGGQISLLLRTTSSSEQVQKLFSP